MISCFLLHPIKYLKDYFPYCRITTIKITSTTNMTSFLYDCEILHFSNHAHPPLFVNHFLLYSSMNRYVLEKISNGHHLGSVITTSWWWGRVIFNARASIFSNSPPKIFLPYNAQYLFQNTITIDKAGGITEPP